jgi:signal peptidase II
MSDALRRQLAFWPAAVIGTALDLASKSLVFGWLRFDWAGRRPLGEHTVVEGFLALQPAANSGTFFGQLGGHNTALIVFTVAMMALVVYMFLAPPREVLAGRRGAFYSAALGLVLAGAAGNLWDRIWYGSVRDFLACSVHDWHWPTFNLADTWLTLGIIAYLIATWRAARAGPPCSAQRATQGGAEPPEPSGEEAPRP